MTTTNSIIDMLVRGGLVEAEAFEYAEAEDAVAEQAYIDFEAEEARDAEEIAYWARVAEEDERYYRENIEPFRAWANEHIWSRTYDEITADDWNFYSDWHKDIYGYRPHGYLAQKREEEQREYLLNEGWIIDTGRDTWELFNIGWGE